VLDVTTSRQLRLPDGRWNHWPGQLCLHPDTRVLADSAIVDRHRASRWALVPVTWAASPWWYGWAPVVLSGTRTDGWWLFPRDPVADPWPPPDGDDPGQGGARGF